VGLWIEIRCAAMFDPGEIDSGRPWAQASLRIASEIMSAEAISDLLGLKPSNQRTSDGDPPFVVWMLESGLAPSAAVEDHLYILMERLNTAGPALSRLCETSTVEIWLSLSAGDRHRSAVLSHRVLGELGRLGIDLVLDAYPSGKH
jgi:hypothetical protein